MVDCPCSSLSSVEEKEWVYLFFLFIRRPQVLEPKEKRFFFFNSVGPDIRGTSQRGEREVEVIFFITQDLEWSMRAGVGVTV